MGIKMAIEVRLIVVIIETDYIEVVNLANNIIERRSFGQF